MKLDFKKDVLFVGLGSTAVCYYRVMLPAQTLGADWVGLIGEPPGHRWITGVVQGDSQLPDFGDYRVVVLQQPVGRGWMRAIKMLKERGIKVVFEVDDYLHGIQHMKDHNARMKYDKKFLRQAEQAMSSCDAIITTTDWIADKYVRFNDNVYICRNGIDLKRYAMTRPERNAVNVGWAGAGGHIQTVIPWLQAVAAIMDIKPHVCFVSIGETFGRAFEEKYGKQRGMTIPWAQIEQYPAAMTMFDIALAPGGKGSWWRGKSDLRWLEASALGIPCVANPRIYPEIEDNVTGVFATSREEAFEKLLVLVGEPKLRDAIGERAKKHVTENRSIEVMAAQWESALEEIAALD